MIAALKNSLKNRLPPKAVSYLRKSNQMRALLWRDIRLQLLGNWLPPKPVSISMMANDICNSRCQMCLIWKQKKDYEITPDDLRQILAEPLFSNIKDVGITGGEPTLRDDLEELFCVVAERKPKIPNASIITNAIREKDVQEKVLRIHQLCAQRGTAFSVMVSLDGLGEVHDTVRGRKGNFESAIACLRKFKEANIPTSFGCTITSSNAAYVDLLLDWAIENQIPGRFRIAEFIERLYNSPQKEYIRNFDPLTAYHLGLFYSRLIHEYETDTALKKTYRSVLGMIAEGKPRTTGCPYHYETVILTSRGELLYCSPKSPIIGSLLEKGKAAHVFFSNLNKRKEIRQKYCDQCIHDYTVPETFTDKVTFYLKNKRIALRYNCPKLIRQASTIPSPQAQVDPAQLQSSKVLIVGWYGTETAGDKAILHTIVQRLRNRSRPPQKIYIASFHPFITQWTQKEMHLEPLHVVETFSPLFETACREVDEVVIGGGPLMDIEAMNHMLYAFIQVKQRRGIARIEGCGIGPLENPTLVELVKQLCRLADQITLRDTASASRCQETWGYKAEVVHDPAVDYVHHWLQQHPATDIDTSNTIGCYLRDWPENYIADLPVSEFTQFKSNFENGLLRLLHKLHEQWHCKIIFHAMHHFYNGGDDRKYARHLARRLQRELAVPENAIEYPLLPTSPSEILASMRSHRLNLCMRFHSVVFASTLQTPFIAVDYTRGGKVFHYLKERQQSHRLFAMEDVIDGRALSIIKNL
jgi:MoaA/NifB/PqqE/SkfB family radical SAM enzyme/polysaccharide pyruvyl transferase WcaK-like protein